MNRMGSGLEIWREYALDVRGGAIEACDHFLPEEQPDVVLRRLLAFLAELGRSCRSRPAAERGDEAE
jgi:hypothetical protein